MSNRKPPQTFVERMPVDYKIDIITDKTSPEADKLAFELVKIAKWAGIQEYTALSENFQQDREVNFNSFVKAARDKFYNAYVKLAEHLGKDEPQDEFLQSEAERGNGAASNYIEAATRISKQRGESTFFTVHDQKSTRMMLDALLIQASDKVKGGSFIDDLDAKAKANIAQQRSSEYTR